MGTASATPDEKHGVYTNSPVSSQCRQEGTKSVQSMQAKTSRPLLYGFRVGEGSPSASTHLASAAIASKSKQKTSLKPQLFFAEAKRILGCARERSNKYT